MTGLRRLLQDCAGGFSVLATLALPVMIGAAGLAYDLNRGYEQRVINQRTADVAALGAALAYKEAGNANVLTATARDIATANGLTGATITAALVDNVPAPGETAVRVTITRSLPFTLARVVGVTGEFDVTAEAFASLTATEQFAPPCYLALSSGSSAITVGGGASIDATTCSVAAVGSIRNNGQLIRAHDIVSGSGDISVDWGTLAAETLRFGGSFHKPAWNNNVPPADRRIARSTTLADPWATNTELGAARALLGTFTAPPALANPSTPPGSDWLFSYSPSPAVQAFKKSDNNYVVPAGNYTINRLEVAGGISVTFQSGSRITIRNGLSNGGAKLTFGDVDLYVNGGFSTGYSGVQIGHGALWIGSGTVSFTSDKNTKGDGDVTINSTLTMGGGQKLVMGRGAHRFGQISMAGGAKALLGDGAFSVSGGVLVDGGGSELVIGNGAVAIGRDSASGNAIRLAGSSVFIMGDGAFSANGNINTEGGSRLVFGKTANHLINGNMTIRGAVLFGAGRYTVAGNFINGTGGTTWPYSSSLAGKTYGNWLEGESVSGFDMAGINVTFILGGTMNLAGGAKTKLMAQMTSTTGAQIGQLLLASDTTAATTWTAGSGNAFTGTIYLPRSAVAMGGGNSTVTSGKCLTLIANTIAVDGGAATGSACPMMSAGSSSETGSIALVR